MQLKIFIVASFFFSVFVLSQNMRFMYELKFVKDSTNRNVVLNDLFSLDTSIKGSTFYNSKSILRDSIMDAYDKSPNNKVISSSDWEKLKSNINYFIKKDQKVTLLDFFGGSYFQYSETNPMIWKVESETSKIGTYNVQKATVNYGGRKWIAWFTNEIPISDGPYKFSGLPGLIIKMVDSKNDYQFDLIKSEKITTAYALSNDFSKAIKIKKEDFAKLMKRQKEDPVSFLPPPPMSASGENTTLTASTKKFQKKVEEETKKDNNPIEFY